MDANMHAEFIVKFIDVYKENADDIYRREVECIRLRTPYILSELAEEDLLAGRYRELAVGFAPQESNGFCFFLNEDVYQQLYAVLDSNWRAKLDPAIDYWRGEVCNAALRRAYPPDIADILVSDAFTVDEGIAFPLYRISGVHLDYGKLVRLGLPGLKALAREALKIGVEQQRLCHGILNCLDIFEQACLRYRDEALKMGKKRLAQNLLAITQRAPENMWEAVQLVHLYAIVSGSYNYGRMDTYLGRFAKEPDALECIIEFWRLINARKITWDARVIIGGIGRENEKEADNFALLAMEASARHRDILPQLTLRFYNGQNPALLQKAYDNFAMGVVYPMLYKDEVNVPAVQKAFGVDEKTAEQYVPFGCGEYVINHCSLGTPSGVINLLAALNQTLENDYESFDDLFAAYCSLVDRHVEALAKQEKMEYDFAGRTAPFFFYTLLMDDCLSRGKPLLQGGVRYLGGTLETYGNINTANSLTAIQQMVFEQKRFTLAQLRQMLRADFVGFAREQKLLLSCPKYGNDDDIADAMAVKVHEHICHSVSSQAKKVGLDSYLVVIINNNANSTMGLKTHASADGRNAFEPMANANNPVGGTNKNGVTAFLNSLVKLDNTIHAGAVQNMKFSRALLVQHRDKFEMLMKAYFKKGQQAMLNILNRGDLEDAIVHPEKYPNLIVRVGGFSARFVELDRQTQKEILSRTLHE